MDGLQLLHPLDGANSSWGISRLWNSVHFLAMFQLSCRLIFTFVSSCSVCFEPPLRTWLPNRSASTIAANIILRSGVAAGFPLFSRQMFENLGVQWACTLLGSLAAIMIPIPLAFQVYGPLLRGKSKLASS